MPLLAVVQRRTATVLALATAAALLPALAPIAQAQPAQAQVVHTFNLPAQPLGDALRAFGRTAGEQVVFRSEWVDGRRSQAVQGQYSGAQALQQLLRGSGLRAQRTGDGVWTLQPAGAQAADGVVVTDTLRVGGHLEHAGGAARDQRGHDDVYDLDITTAYSGREQVERYRGANPADVVKDLVGVFSGDARNSGALDINIRGIQGPGRVPVSIDGGEQALTVWRGYNGVSNRNYVDPNLIGGIQVIKGPGLVRDVHSGIGGALVIKTLDVDDIVAEGQGFGGELKVEGSSNATAPRLPRLHTGEDYRSVEGFPQASPSAPYADRTLLVPVKSRDAETNVFSGEDQAWRLALGLRGEHVDLLAAYAWRKRGNYFSGTRGVDYYDQDPREKHQYQGMDYITTLARYFKPGDEVPNTSSEQESWLLKATWRIGDGQQLRATWRHTLSHYGEIMPSRILSAPEYGRIQWPLSRVDLDVWNLEYEWRPAGSRWLDLRANLWRTETVSDTYTAGGFPNFAGNPEWNPGASPLLRNTALANARNDRTGLTLSNRFALHSTLDLTVGGNWQYETLASGDAYFGRSDGWRMFPRAGRRQEGEGYMTLEWRPADFLTLSAGVRYSRYWAFDDFLQQHPELLTTNATSLQASYRVNELPPRPASLQGEIDKLEASRAFWESIGEGSVVDELRRNLLKRYETPVAVDYGMAWKPDANGNYARATNPCLNGQVAAIPGLLPMVVGTDRTCVIDRASPQAVAGRNDRHRGHAWLPAFSATVRFSPAARAYFRYSEAVRYPSMFESTIAFSGSLNPLYPLKPEHAYNYELGYVHNLAGLFGDAADADLKLDYFVHKTRDVIERDAQFLFDNIGKQTIRGIELQARFDNRRFFTDLGVSRILENEVCDESSAIQLDPNLGRVPNCVQDGFVSGYLLTQATPRLSVNWSLGTRLFDERLELGSRVVHYRRHDNPDLQAYRDHLLTGQGSMLWQNVPFTWGNITTVDAYARWRINDHAIVELVGTNLGNRYYVDPGTRSTLPAPGRTLKLGLTARF